MFLLRNSSSKVAFLRVVKHHHLFKIRLVTNFGLLTARKTTRSLRKVAYHNILRQQLSVRKR